MKGLDQPLIPNGIGRTKKMNEHPKFLHYIRYSYPPHRDIKEQMIKEEARKFEEKVENDLRLIGLGSGGVCYPSHSQTKGETAWTH